MNADLRQWVAALVALAGVMAGPVLAQPPGRNLAAGQPYRLEPAPNYEHCTDIGDQTQLTDGKTVEGYFWTQQGTVGWSGTGSVFITIDLGKVEPIAGVSYHTAAGVAGVSFPSAILVLVSDDAKLWHVAGDLVALSSAEQAPPSSGYAVHTFRTGRLATRGRFVELLVQSTGAFTFVDEIEVARGPDALLAQPAPGQEVSDAHALLRRLRVEAGLRRRLTADLREVATEVDAAPLPTDARKGLRSELASIERLIPSVEVADLERFTTMFFMNDLHARIFAVQAAVWRAHGLDGVVAWPCDRWGMLSPTGVPRPGEVELDVAMMNNEYRSAAFNVSDAGTAPARLKLSIEGLPGGTDPRWVTVHEVLFTDTQSGVPVAAALPRARIDFGRSDGPLMIRAPRGLTRQVWFTFHPRNLPAGEYHGRVELDGTKVKPASIPLHVRIAPVTFPDRPSLHLGGWDYTDRPRCYEVTPDNRDEFLSTLREHFVDSPWAQSPVLATGGYDAEGRMVTPPDPSEFRTWLDRWPDARRYLVFASVGETFAGFRMGTPAFQRAVSAWITWWVKQLGAWKIEPERLGVLLVDEPNEPRQDRIIMEYARVIHAAQPRVVVWEDPTWGDPSRATPGFFELCNVVCPNLPMWVDRGQAFADVYLAQQKAGRRLEFYSCSGPGHLLDPYSYHRLSAWFCWKYGAEGEGFWAFGDSNGASSWNEYLSVVGAYTPLFLDNRTAVAGKHMEAVREGVEDYEYLRMLRDRVKLLERRGVVNDDLAHARRLAETAADRVVGGMTRASLIFWKEPKDRSVADGVRIEVLDALTRLSRF